MFFFFANSRLASAAPQDICGRKLGVIKGVFGGVLRRNRKRSASAACSFRLVSPQSVLPFATKTWSSWETLLLAVTARLLRCAWPVLGTACRNHRRTLLCMACICCMCCMDRLLGRNCAGREVSDSLVSLRAKSAPVAGLNRSLDFAPVIGDPFFTCKDLKREVLHILCKVILKSGSIVSLEDCCWLGWML